MDYEKIYEDFYSKYYSKSEFLIKSYLIKCESEENTFGFAQKEVNKYLSNHTKNNLNLHKYQKLNELYILFNTRYHIYKNNHIQKIFVKILAEFVKIKESELPTDYSYTKFIKDTAILEVVNEILRLLYGNSKLLEMFYDLNMFDEFEIREHKNISLENYPIYKKLIIIKYPDYYNSYAEDEIFEQGKYEEIDLSNSPATEKVIFLQKLGVIDFLRTKQPFSTSINSLATVLSAVTGEKSGTVQPMLNAMLSKNVDTRNNPLESKKPVNKVTQQLIKIGFNLNETI